MPGMQISHRFLIALVLVAPMITAVPGSVLAQGAGSVSGTVTDAVSGAPLVGADIALDGTSLLAATDRAGSFRLAAVPAGQYSLLVTYLGHKTERADVTVTSGQTLVVEVKLAPANFSESVSVTAEPIAEGQARALNQQRTAPNIVNVVSADQIGAFPDPNAAEAASRIPGISITRDQGEGRYVLIRGTEPRLNSMLIDGERIPAPEGDVRQIQLDAVPADQLQSIEVTKALTPDMDADAIGGAVNLVTKQAVGRPTLLFSASGGYNALQESGDQRLFTATAGRRFEAGRFGLLAGFSSSALHRGSDGFLNLKHFEKYYWSYLKKVIFSVTDAGMCFIPFYEGNWEQRLEYMLELPKGKTIARFAFTNLKKAKDVLKGHTCIMGGVPHSLLQTGTPNDVDKFCKELIETVGKGGGFILSPNTGVTNEAKPENVKAMVEAAKKYGRY